MAFFLIDDYLDTTLMNQISTKINHPGDVVSYKRSIDMCQKGYNACELTRYGQRKAYRCRGRYGLMSQEVQYPFEYQLSDTGVSVGWYWSFSRLVLEFQ